MDDDLHILNTNSLTLKTDLIQQANNADMFIDGRQDVQIRLDADCVNNPTWPNFVCDTNKSFKINNGNNNTVFAVNEGGALSTFSNNVKHYRNVAQYSNNTSSIPGTMKIVLPKPWSATMMSVKISGYQYDENYGAWEAEVSGYNDINDNNSSDGNWVRTSAKIRGAAPFSTIRLSYNGTKNVILLGDSNTSWKYPKVVVTDFIAGFSNMDNWDDGWNISIGNDETDIIPGKTVIPPLNETFYGNVGIESTANTGALLARLNQNNATKLWTGLRFDRQNTEKWFIGMDSTNDNLLIRRTASSNDITIDTSGNVTIPGNIYAANTNDTSYYFITAATYKGNLGGVTGANAKCAAEIPFSYFTSIETAATTTSKNITLNAPFVSLNAGGPFTPAFTYNYVTPNNNTAGFNCNPNIAPTTAVDDWTSNANPYYSGGGTGPVGYLSVAGIATLSNINDLDHPVVTSVITTNTANECDKPHPLLCFHP